MPPMPRHPFPDAAVPFLLDPYGFIQKNCRRLGADLFQARLLGMPAICMTGPEAAELFYDESRFTRTNAAPPPVIKTLFGPGGVQTLDGEAHRHRKRMLMSFMTPERLADIAARVRAGLREHAIAWANAERVVLYDEAQKILTRAVCDWCGVPLADDEFERRRADVVAMFDGAGSVGPRHLRSRLGRVRGNRWIAGLVDRVRAGDLDAPEDAPLRVIAEHRDVRGEPLDRRTAANAVLNLIRPTVAIAVWIVHIAHALHEHPAWRSRLAAGDDPGDLERFVQEVRRWYPFFPSVVARVRERFEWNGREFPQGRMVILDLYGTDRDPRVWKDPERFDPDRFKTWDRSPFNFIPQGGGDFFANHRCAGEWLTLEVAKAACAFLVREIRYDVPPQDLRLTRRRLPALPRSRFVMTNVRPA